MKRLETGDWVKGKTKSGEMIIGFIDSIDSYSATVKVRVVECDNEKSRGKMVETPDAWIEKLPVTSFIHEEQIRAVIDLALSTRDEAWFMELSEMLQTYSQEAWDSENRLLHRYSMPRNRLGNRIL